jgi:Tfp pilus assembly protein PilF
VLLQDVVDRPDGRDDPRVTRAETELHHALEINPRIPEGWEGRGLVALIRLDCAAAAAAFQQAASIRPASPAFNRLLQRCAK